MQLSSWVAPKTLISKYTMPLKLELTILMYLMFLKQSSENTMTRLDSPGASVKGGGAIAPSFKKLLTPLDTILNTCLNLLRSCHFLSIMTTCLKPLLTDFSDEMQ